MQIILIDNYDSFTYNLVHYLEKWGAQVHVVLNDSSEPNWTLYDACVISPGPGLPQESAHLMNWMQAWSKTKKPLLGICLGLQAMILHAGGNIKQMENPLHGVEGRLKELDKTSIWHSMKTTQSIGHYHSWMADPNTFPTEYHITAWDEKQQIMVIENHYSHWYGVQFHPESIITKEGYAWIATWCNFVQKLLKA
jgi:anthranilate synthase component 2